MDKISHLIGAKWFTVDLPSLLAATSTAEMKMRSSPDTLASTGLAVSCRRGICGNSHPKVG